MNPPNEILTAVFKHLSDRQLYQCLLVCHGWLTAAQIILYKEIAIDIGFADDIFESLIFDTLVNSAYMPGRWVKKITVKRLKIPDNMFALDPKVDPLHLLMTHCPNVVEFCFDRTSYIFQAEWQYLQTVLEQRKGTWKLRNLSNHFDKQDYDSYYACALIMKDSLTQFYLKKRLGTDYASHLEPFSQLSRLSISSRVITDIIDSDKIIQHLPHLTCLDAEFHIPKTHQAQARTDLTTQYNSQPYRNIKEVTLKNFPISRDQELLFIIQKFTALDTLKIKVAKGKPWPIARISSTVFTDFFRFINTIQDHSITFRDIDVTRALEYYYTSQVEKDGQFHISFTNVLDEGDKSTSLIVSSDECVKLVYNLVGNSSSKTRMEKAQRTLSTYHHHIQHLHLSLLGKHQIAKGVGIFLPLIFESCRNMSQLTVSGGQLSMVISNKLVRRPNVTDLTFNKTHIDLYVLPDLMSLFPPYLDSFQLNNCTFEQDEYTDYATSYTINMFHTAFNTIRISFQDIGMPGVPIRSNDEFGDPLEPIERNDVFIIINLTEQEMTKYYCCDTSVGDPKAVTENDYYVYLDQAKESKQYKLNIFCLTVKSLNSFTLVTPKKFILCEI